MSHVSEPSDREQSKFAILPGTPKENASFHIVLSQANLESNSNIPVILTVWTLRCSVSLFIKLG